MKLEMRIILVALLLALTLTASLAGGAQAQDDAAVVHAVLFYSPTCPHCEEYIENDLPPLYEKYGQQLQVVGVNTLEDDGWALYQAAAEQFSIPENKRGVPTLIVGDTVLAGSAEINARFPTMIEEGLAAGGIGLPDIPALREALPSDAAETDNSVTPAAASLSPLELFKRDLAGNTLAVIVLLGMIAAVAYVGVSGRRAFQMRPSHADNPGTSTPDWLVPLLTVAGLGVALYMTYVETSNAKAVCGPIGDCNTVQQSKYAQLFGVLPVGVLGAIGYVGILVAWAWRRLDGDQSRSALATLAMFGMAGFGVLFSIYLTFLEPFVIGATCAWCLSSALIITALFLLIAQPGIRAARTTLAQPKLSPSRKAGRVRGS